MAMVERVEMMHEKENMVTKEKEMEVKRISLALKCLMFDFRVFLLLAPNSGYSKIPSYPQ